MRNIKAKIKKKNGVVTRFEQQVEIGGKTYFVGAGEEFGGDPMNPSQQVRKTIARIMQTQNDNKKQDVIEEEEVTPVLYGM